LLAAPSQPVRRGLSAAAFESVAANLRAAFNDVVVDAAPTLDEATQAALESARSIIIVLSPDVGSVQTTTGALRTLAEMGVADGSVRLVLNQVSPEGALPQAAVEKALNRPMDAFIPFDRGQAAALMHGQPLGLSQPSAPLVTALGQFAVKA
jgi:Flp pilus assembly CpaE family ATPase